MKKLLIATLILSFTQSFVAQQRTAFVRVGSQDESIQEFFPGEIRARPVLGNYTGGEYMGLFCGGQDLASNRDWYADKRWGDQGDGTFANPVLNADFSDPDVIRVGDKYYMTCSEFHFMGMPILESEDMVNWHVVSHIFSSIDLAGYSTMERYGGGTWAPALRYHDGKYYMYVCTPNEGLFMSSATDIKGPWEPLYQVKNVSGWEDPCPFWDENGQAYLGRSQLGAGPIILHKMSADGRTLLDNGKEIYRGNTAEGTKIFKKDGYYYLSIPEGGVGTGWQTVLRGKSIYGPFERKVVLERGSTNINGPHQGALVDTPDGEWWFFHFQSTDPLGRVVHLQPVTWKDGFPTIGYDYDGNGIGEPMKICSKPNVGKTVTAHAPQGSDDFNETTLNPIWQFNHNPDNAHWSLSAREGWLTIIPMLAKNLREARNQFTQKLMGYEGRTTVKIDYAELNDYSRTGMECIGSKFVAVGIRKSQGNAQIYIEKDGEVKILRTIEESANHIIYVRLTFDAQKNHFQFSYSLDGLSFMDAGDHFEEASRDWKGCRVGLYSYTTSTTQEGGKAYFDDFEYLSDGPTLINK